MDNLEFALGELEERKNKIQREIFGLFEYDKWPSDLEYLGLLGYAVELHNIEYAISKINDVK